MGFMDFICEIRGLLFKHYWKLANVYFGKGINPMSQSQVLFEMKMKRRKSHSALSPEQKMLTAFSLSMEARKFRIAGLRSQGFSEAEILQILKARR
jgi:hypothetical protein